MTSSVSSGVDGSHADHLKQSKSEPGRLALLDTPHFLSSLTARLSSDDDADQRRACLLLRNLGAHDAADVRRRLAPTITPLLNIIADASTRSRLVAAQALVNLVRGAPDLAKLAMIPLVADGRAVPCLDSAVGHVVRAFIFTCIRCDDECLDALLAHPELLQHQLLVNRDMDDTSSFEWAYFTIRYLAERGQLAVICTLPPCQRRLVFEVVENHIDRDAADLSSATLSAIGDVVLSALRDWLDRFGASLLAQQIDAITEADLDLIYTVGTCANTVIVRANSDTSVVDEMVAAGLTDIALNLLAACGQDDGPKPTRLPNPDDALITPQSMKVVLVRLLANLAGLSQTAKQRIGQHDALVLLLNQCKIDDKNPFMREWVILAIRHLTADDPEIQERIASLKLTSLNTITVEM